MGTELNKIVPVILAGGTGTRLWPMSRASRPKQFLPLIGEKSLFQQTLLRTKDLGLYGPPVIISNADYRFLVAEQAAEIDVELGAILLEPVARNTAAAIVAASHFASSENADTILHVMPSDHAIEADQTYRDAIQSAFETAKNGALVTFGVEPTEPATGYGYIASGEARDSGAYGVAQFVEKPDAEAATAMLKKGGYFWNSGMFVFLANKLLEECADLAPEIHEQTQKAVQDAITDLDFVRLEEESFAQSPSIAIDRAIFEKTKNAAVVPTTIQWSDLGSWDAVWQAGQQDDSDNVAMGEAQVKNSSKTLAISEKLPVFVEGVEDLAVIASEDAILVQKLSNAQDVGNLVKRLKQDERFASLTAQHQTSYRPWGGYSSILSGARFQVKKLFVKPGKQLSLQKHHHRSEHWVVVKGTAEVTIGDMVKTISENESVYIKRGEVHRLANPGKIELELIEVQTGSYLEEDDIIRIEDEFGRS